MTPAPSIAKSVLMIVQNLPVPFDRRVWQEANSLSRAGFSVSIICPRSKVHARFYERLDGIQIYRYPLLIESSDSLVGYLLEFAYCWLATLLLAVVAYLRDPFRIIHACNPPDTYFAIAQLFRPLGVKFVFDLHDLCPELYLAKGHQPQGIAYKTLLLLERLTFGTADMVIAVNQSYRQVARTRGRVPDNKVVVVRSGPRLNWAQFYEPSLDLKQGKKHLVVFLGQIGKQDGLDYLLRSIRIYRDCYGNDARFVIIGDGPNQKKMQELAADLHIMDSVAFLGRISDAQLFRYLSDADVCVDPDPCTPFNSCSTMNKIIEYMSFGKAIVAFDLVEHRRSALEAAHYIVPNKVDEFAHGIRELLDDEARRRRMGKFGKKRFEEVLAWDLTESTLIRAYEQLIVGDEALLPRSREVKHGYSRDRVAVAEKVA